MADDFDDAFWARAETIFDGALELEGEAREAFLRERCADDPALRAEVDALLEAAEAPGLLDHSLGELASALAREAHEALESRSSFEGRVVGSWRIVDTLGVGGMGRVFRAERADGEFRQECALKLLRWDVASAEVAERFRRERQILAELQHPGIAPLLDGGVVEDGLPYLAMELVEGEPITDWCRSRGLDVRQRLRLFLQVVDAVQYAHRNLVVHRDLKPSNILVTPEGNVRLLDFGIAKILDETAAESDLTRTRLAPATPRFAAPEQLAGGAVTTASDVWALGVLLYELLTDTSPFSGDQDSLSAITQRVLHQDPTRPSQTVSGPRQRLLRGDLDNIVMVALRKEPERRYGSAESLGQDLRLFLDGLPVSAGPATWSYRASKFVQRHRAGVNVTAISVLLLIALVTFYTVRLSRERDRVAQQARKTEQVKSFVLSLFEVNDPSRSRGEEISARELLDRGAERIDEELMGQPEIRGEMHHVVGGLYETLGVADRADQSFRRALELRRQVLGPDHPDVAQTLMRWGFVLLEMDRPDSAETVLRESLEIWEEHPHDPLGRASALNQLGMMLSYQGEYEEAESMLRESLALKEEALEPDDPQIATTLTNLGLTLKWSGDFDTAETLYRRALEIRRTSLGPDHPEIALTLDNLGVLLGQRGDYAESEACFREALRLRRSALGEDHPDVALNLNNLATLFRVQGRLDEAEPIYRQVLEMNEREWGPDHRRVATNLANLASIELQRGNYETAVSELERALEIRIDKLGPDHSQVATTLDLLVVALIRQGEFERAEPLSERALEIVDGAVDEKSHDRVPILRHRAELLLGLGRLDEAEPLLREALQVGEEVLAPDHWQTATTRVVLGELLAERKDWVPAEGFLLAGHDVLREERGVDDPETRRARRQLHDLYVDWGRPDEARRYAADG